MYTGIIEVSRPPWILPVPLHFFIASILEKTVYSVMCYIALSYLRSRKKNTATQAYFVFLYLYRDLLLSLLYSMYVYMYVWRERESGGAIKSSIGNYGSYNHSVYPIYHLWFQSPSFTNVPLHVQKAL
jgi:hypothetical protein